MLKNCTSIEKNFGNIMNKLDMSKDFPDVCFSNTTGTENLRLIFYPGDAKNSINDSSRTTIRYVTDEKRDKDFLRRYNIPSYCSQYTFQNGKLLKFSFGFEYP